MPSRDLRRTFRRILFHVLMCLSPGLAMAAEPVAPGRSLAMPEQDDATLHDVCFVDARRGWAVGDRGTIWRTDDAGENWEFLAAPATESLSSVHFIDPRHGWVAGAGTTPFTRQPIGVVLATADGGVTWIKVANQTLPRLRHLQFFDEDRGIAVGESNRSFPSGVLMTLDGGRVWLPMAGPSAEGWNTGAFINPDYGILGGRNGTLTTVSAGGLNSTPETGSLRGYRAAAIDASARVVWIAGEGGRIQRSDDAGKSWVNADQNLPREAQLLFDFGAIACAQGHVWVAGTPGSVVWHSDDGGKTWTPRFTGETTPIESLACPGGDRLVAVGALGKILVSDDAGKNWRTVRGAGRRLAALDIHAHVERTSFMALALDASERGYRIGNWTLVRRDVGNVFPEGRELQNRFGDAVLAAGGTGVQIDWRLPVAIPGLDRQREALLNEWSILTDQNLEEVLITVLATALRTWRPDVLLLDDPPRDDYPSQMLRAAVIKAVAQAGDVSNERSQRFWRVSGLPPWRPVRAFERRPPGSDGAPIFDPFDWLGRRGTTLVAAAAEFRSRLQTDVGDLQQREAWTEIALDGASDSGEAGMKPLRDFFQDLPLTPGGDARRALPAMAEGDYEKRLEGARRQRAFAAISRQVLQESGNGDALLGQLSETLRGLTPQQAALQLVALAEEYRAHGNWDAAEATLMELVSHYPEQPVAHAAMRWLLVFWAADELEWQRLARSTMQREVVEPSNGATNAGGAREPRPVTLAGGTITIGDAQSVLAVAGRAVDQDVPFGEAVGRRRLDVTKRDAQAAHLLTVLEKAAPELFQDPAMQMLRVAFLRRANRHREADSVLNDLSGMGGGWGRVAQGELWLLRPQVQSPQAVYVCRRVDQPPLLDGLLSDRCWDACADLRLKSPGDDHGSELSADDSPPTRATPPKTTNPVGGSFCMFARDEKYLYVALSATRQKSLPSRRPEYAGRPYDADLDGFDRFSLAFDVNRDYASFFRFDVDQRGWTRDACWEYQPWNPKWHVACDADDQFWRVEAAIPWSELGPRPPARGAVWAMGVMRTMPGLGRQSWQWPTSDAFQPEGFGLLQFD